MTKEILRNRKEFYLAALLAIMVLGLLLRGYSLFVPVADWHSFRQVDTVSVSRIYKEEGIDLLHPRYHDVSNTQSGHFNPQGFRMVEFPLYNASITISEKLFSTFTLETWGRMLSIYAALCTTYLMFLIMKKFVKAEYALLSSSLYLVIPFNIYFTRVILPEPVAIMFAIASMWFFIVHIDDDKLLNLLFSGMLMSIALLIKPFVFFYSIPMIYLLYRKKRLRKMLKMKYVVFSLIILLPFLIWRNWIGQFPEGIPFWKWTLNGDGIRFKPAFFRWLFSERIGKLILGVWGVFIFVFGLIGSSRRSRFFQSLAAGAFVYLSIFATANVRHDYYQTIIIPVIIMVFSFGTYKFLQFKYHKSTKIIVTSSIFFLMIITTLGFVKENYKINNPDIIRAGLSVRKLVPKNSLIIAPYNGDTAFLYQTRRRGWPVVDFPIDELIQRGAEYFVSVNLDHYQTVDFSERFQILEKTDRYIILKLN